MKVKSIRIILAFFLFSCGSEYVRIPAEIVPDLEILTTDYDWQEYIGFGPQDNETSSTLIFDEEVIVVPSASGVIYVIDKDGDRLRKVELGEKIFANITYRGGIAYVVSAKGNLIVVNLETEEIVKKYIGSMTFSAPLVEKGLILVQTTDGGITAINAATLQEMWRYLDSNQDDIALWGAAELFSMQGFVLAGLNDGRLVLLELSSGRVVWQHNLSNNLIKMPDEDELLEHVRSNSAIYNMNDITANFVVDNSKAMIYAVAMKGYLTAFSLQNLQVSWQIPMGSYLTPALNRNFLVVVDRRNYIYKINATTGKVLWKNQDFKDRNLTNPVIVESQYVVFGDGFGYIHILNLDDGSYIAKNKIAKYAFTPSAIHYDSETERVYAMDKFGMLFSLYISEYKNRRDSNPAESVQREIEYHKKKKEQERLDKIKEEQEEQERAKGQGNNANHTLPTLEDNPDD